MDGKRWKMTKKRTKSTISESFVLFTKTINQATDSTRSFAKKRYGRIDKSVAMNPFVASKVIGLNIVAETEIRGEKISVADAAANCFTKESDENNFSDYPDAQRQQLVRLNEFPLYIYISVWWW